MISLRRELDYHNGLMLHAIVRSVYPHDFASVDDFISFVPPDVTVHYGWIVLVIGTDETDPEYFQCLVSTPLALEEALFRSKDCLVHIVERYEPANILSTLLARVENSKGNTWIEIVDQLRTFMRWERG